MGNMHVFSELEISKFVENLQYGALKGVGTKTARVKERMQPENNREQADKGMLQMMLHMCCEITHDGLCDS